MGFSFSYNEEQTYTGDYSTRAEAIAAARGEGAEVFWTGENAEPEIDLSPLSGELICESILDQSEDLSDDWPDCDSLVYHDLTCALRDAFNAWLDRHKLRPEGFVVSGIEKHDFTTKTWNSIPMRHT
jgi:hypothetical protein